MSTLIHSFDVETSGPKIGPRRLMSIAACVLEVDPSGRRREIINRFFGVVAWPEGILYDCPATHAFWKREPMAWKMSTTGGQPPHVVAHRLCEHIAEVQRVAIKRNAKYVVLTDNAYFDVPWIDWFLCTYTDAGLPLRHNYHTGWMRDGVVDLSERLNALKDVSIDIAMSSFRPSVPSDHNPLNDATANAERYAYYLRQIHRLTRSHRAFSRPLPPLL